MWHEKIPIGNTKFLQTSVLKLLFTIFPIKIILPISFGFLGDFETPAL